MSTTTDIASATAAAGIASAPTTKHKTANDLNVSDFLALMTAQLQNQDPLKPLDSNAFVAQLAQFGTVSGVQGMQTSLASLSTALQSSQMLTGASLVGHSILAAASSAQYSGGSVNGQLTVPEGSTKVTLTISDSTGQAVRHIVMDPTAGTQGFSWDGKSDTGAQLAAGQYTLQAVSTTGQTNESLETFLDGTVRSVSLDASGAGLTVNTAELGAIGLGSVREII
jgi:flagellar basal-body rod modification protein FlgD